MKKKLKDITIGDFISICSEHPDCIGCPFLHFARCGDVEEMLAEEPDCEFEIKEENP